MDWVPVKAGDFIYSPAGTIHALGAGLTVIEIQQNLDLTYRLYDYGRPRELHLDDGIACSTLAPFLPPKNLRPVMFLEKRTTVEKLEQGNALWLIWEAELAGSSPCGYEPDRKTSACS